MSKKWTPNKKIIEYLKELTRNPTQNQRRLAVGSRVLTWREILEEIQKGTDFGRRYHNSMLKSSLFHG